MSIGNLGKVRAAIADAAFDPEGWTPLTNALSEAAGAAGILLIPVSGRAPGIPHTETMARLVESYFKDKWYLHDLRELGFPRLFQTGIMVDQDFITPEGMKRSPYYQDFLAPQGLQWFAGLAFNAADDVWVAALQRTPEQGPFSIEEQDALLGIREELTMAATILRRLGMARVQSYTTLFEATDSAFVLFGRAGQVLVMNNKAEEVIKGTLRLSNGKLTAMLPGDDRALQTELSKRLVEDPSQQTLRHRPVIVRRQHGRPIMLHLMTLPSSIRDCFAPARAIALIVDPSAKPSNGQGILQSYFGLSQAEASVAVHVALGESLESYAELNSRSIGTVRQLMKSILAKSGTHRQGEFISLATRVLVNR